jgi:hypothetical protein
MVTRVAPDGQVDDAYEFFISAETWPGNNEGCDIGFTDPNGGSQSLLLINEDTKVIGFYPNPIGSELTIKFNEQREPANTIRVLDNLGMVIFKDQILLDEGVDQYKVDLFDIENGFFILQVNDGLSSYSSPFIKQ